MCNPSLWKSNSGTALKKPLVQLATGETRSLRKSAVCAEKNVCLFLFTFWDGQEQGGPAGFVLGKSLWYCHLSCGGVRLVQCVNVGRGVLLLQVEPCE